MGLLLAAGCGGKDAAPLDAARVAVVRLAFTPTELTVPAGTTVTWRSQEPIGHTVTSGEATGVDPATGLRGGEQPDGRFDAPLASTGATHSFRFTSPGTYTYYCAIHKGMNARVVVS